MCLIVIAHRTHPGFPLVVAANRDEYHRRPTAPAAFWDDAPAVLAGRDLEAGGTWMGVTRGGRFAAITNYRDPDSHRPEARSRGALVSAFLTGDAPVLDYLEAVARDGAAYNGFSLLAAEGDVLGWCSNRTPGVRRLEPGIYGLSNHLLDTPWPKLVSSREALAALIASGRVEPEALLDLMDHREAAPAHLLPDTGVGSERERWLSSRFVVGADYGTRSSTALVVDAGGGLALVERSFGPDGVEQGRVSYHLHLEAHPESEAP